MLSTFYGCYRKMNELDNLLNELGLTFEDVFEPDLNKQYENYKLLCQILDAEEPRPHKITRKKWCDSVPADERKAVYYIVIEKK